MSKNASLRRHEPDQVVRVRRNPPISAKGSPSVYVIVSYEVYSIL